MALFDDDDLSAEKNLLRTMAARQQARLAGWHWLAKNYKGSEAKSGRHLA